MSLRSRDDDTRLVAARRRAKIGGQLPGVYGACSDVNAVGMSRTNLRARKGRRWARDVLQSFPMGPVSIARRLAALVAIASVTCAIACASPTLPLPPPGIPSITDQGVPAGEVQLSSVSGAEPNALVLVYNQNPSLSDTERGALTQADGTGKLDGRRARVDRRLPRDSAGDRHRAEHRHRRAHRCSDVAG